MNNNEINEAVAKKLGPDRKKHFQAGFDDSHLQHPSLINYEVRPNYCHSIAAAWEIVDHLIKTEFQVILNMDSWGQCACNIHERKEFRMVATEQADTAPMAICKAFLKLPS
jgi:hypothetical protein